MARKVQIKIKLKARKVTENKTEARWLEKLQIKIKLKARKVTNQESLLRRQKRDELYYLA